MSYCELQCGKISFISVYPFCIYDPANNHPMMCPLPPHPRVQVLFPNSFLLLLSSPLSCICHPLPESALCCCLVSHFTLCVPAPPLWKSAQTPPPSRLCRSRPLDQNPSGEPCAPQSCGSCSRSPSRVAGRAGGRAGGRGWQGADGSQSDRFSLLPDTPEKNHTFHLVVVRNNMLKKPGITKLLN